MVLPAARRELVNVAIAAGVFRPSGIERLSVSTDAQEQERQRLEPIGKAAVAALLEGLAIIAADPGLEVIGINAAVETAWSTALEANPIPSHLLARSLVVYWTADQLTVAGVDGEPDVQYLDVFVSPIRQASRRAKRPPQRRGPRPSRVWEDIKPDVTVWLEKDALRPTGTAGKQAALERYIGDLLEQRGFTHSSSIIRRHARAYLAR